MLLSLCHMTHQALLEMTPRHRDRSKPEHCQICPQTQTKQNKKLKGDQRYKTEVLVLALYVADSCQDHPHCRGSSKHPQEWLLSTEPGEVLSTARCGPQTRKDPHPQRKPLCKQKPYKIIKAKKERV